MVEIKLYYELPQDLEKNTLIFHKYYESNFNTYQCKYTFAGNK